MCGACARGHVAREVFACEHVHVSAAFRAKATPRKRSRVIIWHVQLAHGCNGQLSAHAMSVAVEDDKSEDECVTMPTRVQVQSHALCTFEDFAFKAPTKKRAYVIPWHVHTEHGVNGHHLHSARRLAAQARNSIDECAWEVRE